MSSKSPSGNNGKSSKGPKWLMGIFLVLVLFIFLGLLWPQEGSSQYEWLQIVPSGIASSCSHGLRRLNNSGGGEDNPLWQYFNSVEKGPVVHKWTGYFDIYERYFARYVGKELTMLEIGVQSGGSLKMWQHYFGPGLTLYGIDINPYIKALFDKPPKVNIFIGSQDNRTFWQEFLKTAPKFDIVLDDGGHLMSQQINTFEEVFPHVKDGGVYIVEDTLTQYSWGVGHGGDKQDITWMDYSKLYVDQLQLQAPPAGSKAKNFMNDILAMAYYDQMVVFEKGTHVAATDPKRGTASFKYVLPLAPDGQLDQNILNDLKAKFAEQ